ncbi:hypothetical protein D6D01_04927, partial [Aureobasidium pullulans]
LRVTAARPGVYTLYLLQSSPYHTSLTSYQNRLNILHGGTIASMVDLGGSLAVASRGLFATGVSTDLNVGKTLAYTSINFHNEKQELVARGSHTKYVSFAWKDPNNIVEEMSPKPEK